MATNRTFLPFGEFLPDRRQLSNEGLLRAFGVIPLAGNYIQAPEFIEHERVLTENPVYGLGLHSTVASGVSQLYAYYGATAKLYEVRLRPSPVVETDRSRLVGGAYSWVGGANPLDSEMWWFASYGNNVVATNFQDAVQLLSTPGSGNFAAMITSTWKPQARFVFPIRQNLFLAYIFSPSNYDTVTSGTHPQLVAWSMNDTLQSFGSKNVDPAFSGAGYNPLNNDFGPITAAIGGDFGIVFQVGGIVRIDGPLYEFRAIVEGDSTLYPYSVFRLGDDIYFWGAGGPSVLRGGEPPVVRLGLGKLQRSLLDDLTGFGADFALNNKEVRPRDISGAADSVNEILRWGYPPIHNANAGETDESGVLPVSATIFLDYSIREERFAVARAPGLIANLGGGQYHTVVVRFLRSSGLREGGVWGPHGNTFCVGQNDVSPALLGFQLEGEDGVAADLEFQTGFGRLDPNRTTRITAVRPIWTNAAAVGDTIAGAVSVYVLTKNAPYDDATETGPFTVFNDDGQIGTDDSVVGSYHSVRLLFSALTQEIQKIHEIEGLEIEYLEGGSYGA